ncbi:hypothetical protein [Mesorhizobium retamae]|uniref:Flagellar FliJ protein n=1 Tax=Mesorhizobium retamae TaxID=2912854 RepID=A0ABS9QBA2_9HYPH|nr:hypothetical protein [Mesorhizobium sp. IRAMC:0171]MCG7504697.1 hypothetical protein [Mesorhizobium sp. IRAMC:0171]
MSTRKDRLKKLVEVQEQLKALHEMRRAGFLAKAVAAGQEAADIAARFDAPDSLSTLFPEIYQQRIAAALAERDRNLEAARLETGNLATATARTNMVERAYRDARREHERQRSDRERLELIEQKFGSEK